MSDDSVRGLAYLALTVGALSGLAILILAILLGRARAEVARLLGELSAAEQRVRLVEARAKIEGSGDAELADDLAGALRGRVRDRDG